MLSNGPGDPKADNIEAIETKKIMNMGKTALRHLPGHHAAGACKRL